MHNETFSAPVLVRTGTSPRASILTVRSAARFLTGRWPEDSRGETYRAALHACADVIEGYGSADIAEKAFRAAAIEAGILAQRDTRRREQGFRSAA